MSFSYEVAGLVVTVGIATIVVNVKDLTSVVAIAHITVLIAFVIKEVVGVLPFCHENYVLVGGHSVEIPLGSEYHPTNDLVACLLGNAGRYQFRAFFNRLGFKNHTAFGFEGYVNRLAKAESAEINAGCGEYRQQSQA